MYSSIVVGTDGSETAHKAVGEAITLAKTNGAKLHVVTAYQESTLRRAERELADAPPDIRASVAVRDAIDANATKAEILAAKQGVAVQKHVVNEEPASALLHVAAESDADLIVVGSKGMNGVKRVLGSVPNKVTHHADCSVLVVHTT